MSTENVPGQEKLAFDEAMDEALKIQKTIKEGRAKTYGRAEKIVDKEEREAFERTFGVFKTFKKIIEEVSPNLENDYDDFSGLTFWLTPFESEEEKKQIIDTVLAKMREAYQVDNHWIVDAENMDWLLYATEEGNKLRWSCQELFGTLGKKDRKPKDNS